MIWNWCLHFFGSYMCACEYAFNTLWKVWIRWSSYPCSLQVLTLLLQFLLLCRCRDWGMHRNIRQMELPPLHLCALGSGARVEVFLGFGDFNQSLSYCEVTTCKKREIVRGDNCEYHLSKQGAVLRRSNDGCLGYLLLMFCGSFKTCVCNGGADAN